MVVWSGERVSARSKQPRLCREKERLDVIERDRARCN